MKAAERKVVVSQFKDVVQDTPHPIAHLALETLARASGNNLSEANDHTMDVATRLGVGDEAEVRAAERRLVPYMPTIVEVFQEVNAMVDEAVEGFAFEAFKALPEKDQQELAQLIAGRLRNPASIDSVTAQGRAAIHKVIAVLVERELEASRDVLMHRIATLVAEKWETEVEAVVGKKMAEAIAKVKAEMVR